MIKTLSKSWFDFEKKDEFRDFIIVSALGLLIPIFLSRLISLIFGENSLITSNSQLIVDTIITSLLIVSSLNFKGFKKNIFVVSMPVIGLVFYSNIFDSNYSIWMLPAIWLGNLLFIFIFKKLMIEKKFNYFLTGLIAVIIKTLIIFLGFSILNAIGIFRVDLIDTLKYLMGTSQAFSGILGVLLGYLIYTSYRF